MLFNTHSHVDTGRQFASDREEVLARAREMGVERLMVIGFNRELMPITLKFAEEHDGVYAAVGIHPTDALEWGPEAERELRAAARSAKVKAIGEIGLDYYWKDRAPFEVQRQVFRQQIRIARELKLPLVIHDRDAHEDTVSILEEEQAQEIGGIMHCFAGDWAIAERCLALGFFIGVGGTVTYRNNPVGREVAQRLPLDRIVLETDDPYLAPMPHRGRRNEPGYVRLVAEFLAELRGLSLEEIAAATTANALRALHIEP